MYRTSIFLFLWSVYGLSNASTGSPSDYDLRCGTKAYLIDSLAVMKNTQFKSYKRIKSAPNNIPDSVHIIYKKLLDLPINPSDKLVKERIGKPDKYKKSYFETYVWYDGKSRAGSTPR
jgi:hypothetical protein